MNHKPLYLYIFNLSIKFDQCITISSRTKINDYLCRKYVVEEILQDITDSTSYKGRSMSQDSHVTRTMSAMQADQGSSAYNAWLIKYTFKI